MDRRRGIGQLGTFDERNWLSILGPSGSDTQLTVRIATPAPEATIRSQRAGMLEANAGTSPFR